jgi:hypothetical protein
LSITETILTKRATALLAMAAIGYRSSRESIIMLPFDPNINDVADGAVLEALEFL